MRVQTGPGQIEVRPVFITCTLRRVRALLFNFDIDDASLKPQHQKWLDDNVVPNLTNATRIALFGTASRSGADAYNQKLSERRVKTIRDYLVGKGAAPTIISESAAGEQAAAQAGQVNGSEDPKFRAVEVALETPATITVKVRVHLLDRMTRKIPSILGARGKDHFVAAKNNKGVILEALASGPCGPPSNVTWEAFNEAGTPIPVIAPGVGSNPLTVRLPSDVSRKIRVRLLASGTLLWEGFVWLVFANITATPRPNLFTTNVTDMTIGQGFRFTHTITPPSIISTTADVPNLTGPKTTQLPGGTNHAGDTLQGGADRKWDNSRKIRKKFINPSNISLAAIGGNPSFHTTFPTYPSAADGDGHPGGVGAIDPDLVAIVGNDDAGTGDPEDNDPYTDPNRGKLTGVDRPRRSVDHSVGSDGDTLEWRLHFIEFTRLEIGGKWFRISDDFLWRTHLRIRRVNGRWVDNGSLKELNNAGF